VRRLSVKRIGVIGLGDIAQKVYLPLLAANTSIELAGIMSATASTVQRIQAQYRLPFGTTNLDELLGQELDAVFVHSPTETHYSLVKECLHRGVQVYVDKPLSYEWNESVELAALAEKKGLLLGVGFNRRYAPLYIEARRWMQDAGGFDWCSAAKHRIKQQAHNARKTFYDDLIHMLDLLVWLGDGSFEVAAHQQQVDGEGKLLHASGSLTLGTSTGTYSMVRLSGVDLEKLELHGSGRAVEVINLESAVFYEKGCAPVSRGFGSWDSILRRRGFEGVVEHFLQSLEDPASCGIRADQVLATHSLVEKLAL
jgi:virulence factor